MNCVYIESHPKNVHSLAMSTSDVKSINWTEFESAAAVCDGMYPTKSKGGEMPDEVFTVHATAIRKAAQNLQNVILTAAKASERVNLKFLSAAQVAVQSAKDNAIVSLIAPYNPKAQRKSMSD